MNPIRIYQNLRIKYKLLVAYFIVPILFVLGIGYISYLSSTDALEKQGYSMINQHQQNTMAEVMKNLNRYEFMANTIYSNLRIQQLISYNYKGSYLEYDTVRNVLNPSLQAILDASGIGINIQLIRYNDIKGEIIRSNIEGLLNESPLEDYYIDNGKGQFQVVNYDRIKNFSWIHDVKGQLDGDKWLQVGYDKQYNYISLLHEIVDVSAYSMEKIGLLRLTIAFDAIYSEDMGKSESSFNLIFNGADELLSVEDGKIAFFSKNEKLLREFISSPKDTAMLPDQNIIIIKSKPFNNDWYIISAFPMSYITDNVSKIRNVTIISFVVSGVLLFLLTFLLSSSFSKRINIITEQMQNFRPGKLTNKVANGGQDEIGYLSEVFNDMTGQISTLIVDNYQSSIDKKDALLRALQAQINPHFLYNSLSAVGRLAELGETNDILCMVHALTKFYRMTLNKGHETISVADELEQVKAYIEVFRIRKGETFNIFYDIDNSVLNYKTIKVIIQPFVENIFEHAMDIDESIVNIVISAYSKDNGLEFIIEDDGIGMSEDRLKKLIITENSESYGVFNVNERIRLQFGDEYGVTINSVVGQGTTVKIRIPKVL